MSQPKVFNVLRGDAASTRTSPHGVVGEVFSGEGIEVVWVAKQDEEIDSSWFSQGTVDVILVVQGRLRVEFASPELDSLTLDPGEALVLPADMECRAYRWPREAAEATIFVAAYPQAKGRPVA
ncbi:MAG TPA: hypothetical protein VF895_03045 [Gaiellaceae bacterium]